MITAFNPPKKQNPRLLKKIAPIDIYLDAETDKPIEQFLEENWHSASQRTLSVPRKTSIKAPN